MGNIGLEPSARRMPSLVLLFGLTLSFMLMLSQRLRLQTVLHSRQVQRSNQALEASLQRQASLQTLNQRIMLHSTDLLLTLNAHGRIIEINSACYPLLGYRPEELVGRILLDYVLAEDQAVTRSTLNATMSGSRRVTFRTDAGTRTAASPTCSGHAAGRRANTASSARAMTLPT
ncbi:PAS domain-containing protein [Pseudomonas lalucatii]|nr:PAS domain-containing protein [Pseudomonas lalucatii]MBS7723936.1 PAS domain-containing protein [Pseudomonas lalucatii]QVM88061.1 PAS domain-containing protein [Pseudomonas lalucatii]